MKVSDEDREERQKAQQEAQARVEEKKAADKEQRLKDLAAEKEKAMLKAGSKKK